MKRYISEIIDSIKLVLFIAVVFAIKPFDTITVTVTVERQK